MAEMQSRVTLRLALDTSHWRVHDKAYWAQTLVSAVDAAAPHLLRIEGYEIGDTLVSLRLRASEKPARLLKLWRDDESMLRLKSRLFDLGAVPEFLVEEA